MITDTLKFAKSWLVLGIVALSPCVGAMEMEDINTISPDESALAIHTERRCGPSLNLRTEEFNSVMTALQQLFINAHDDAIFGLNFLNQPFPNTVQVTQDLKDVAFLFARINHVVEQNVQADFSNYMAAERAYLLSLNTCGARPTLQNQASLWFRAGRQIAEYFNLISEVNEEEAQELISLFDQLTLARMNAYNNYALICPAGTTVTNIVAADNFYTQSRAIVAQIAIIYAKRIAHFEKVFPN